MDEETLHYKNYLNKLETINVHNFKYNQGKYTSYMEVDFLTDLTADELTTELDFLWEARYKKEFHPTSAKPESVEEFEVE